MATESYINEKGGRPVWLLRSGLALLFHLWLVSCPLMGQVKPHHVLQANDYQLWHGLTLQSTSKKADWISYLLSYENGADTLVVEGTNKSKRYLFPGGYHGNFSGSDYFACRTNKGWQLLNLRSGRIKAFASAEILEFSTSGKKVAVVTSDEPGRRRLEIFDTDNKLLMTLSDIGQFTADSETSKIAYTVDNGNKSTVQVMDFNNPRQITTVAEVLHSKFVELRWQCSGSRLLFLEKQQATSEILQLCVYDVKTSKMHSLEASELHPLSPAATFASTVGQYFKLDLNGTNLFFVYEMLNQPVAVTETVEIWKGNDIKTYSQQIASRSYPTQQVARWSLSDNTLRPINTAQESIVRLTEDSQFALVANTEKYPMWHRQNNVVDYELIDLDRGERRLWAAKHSSRPNHLSPSPGGKYVLSFNKGNWSVYSLEAQIFLMLTDKICLPFYKEDEPTGGEKEAFGIAGWSSNGENVILYDQYDLWSFSCVTGKSERLTNGREAKIRFRMPATRVANGLEDHHRSIDLNSPIVLEAAGEDASSGYFTWSRNTQAQPLSYGNFKSTQSIIKGEVITYVAQTFNTAPRIVQATPKGEVKVIYASNGHQEKFQWPRSERITYKNTQGKTLNGILCYPAGYDPSRLYPMVVHIYQLQFHEFHSYPFPVTYHSNGFDPQAFLSDGYLLLYPDIDTEVDRAGSSALECVMAAVDHVVKKGIVDEARIGLIGHSFGGYETNFIISQTGRFAAAVAGGAITDLQSYYLGCNLAGETDMWRIEDQQWKMSQSLFEDRKTYYENSPIHYAENITTPLLAWSGKEDTQVNYQQSIEMYLALKRLNKKQVLLLYPREQHLMTKPESQLDVTKRIKDWFDYFLKGAVSKEWIEEALK